MALPLRELGKTGVKIPAIGFGCMVCFIIIEKKKIKNILIDHVLNN